MILIVVFLFLWLPAGFYSGEVAHQKGYRGALALPTAVNAGIVDAEIKGLGLGPDDQ